MGGEMGWGKEKAEEIRSGYLDSARLGGKF